ncbi:MAG: ATP-binding cassette domain-containing protein [Elusimicrobia bacterium]|nr:ATP-binding cassette domain-containing protein [Elusimicrobiota bacterium]
MITINRLKKTYDGHLALDIDHLEIPAAKTFAVIGPSGCGKSTLLRLIIRLIKPDSGTIAIAEEIINDATERKLRQKMGYVIQEGGLFPHLTALKNVILMSERLAWPKEKINQRVEELGDLAGLTSRQLGRYPAQLSGGQRQRVSLMRALMLDPPVILMDEPLGALDPLIRARLQCDLKKVFNSLKTKKTIVLVTHDVAEAAFFGHQILLMKEGRVIQQGSAQELLHSPSDPFVTEFIRAQRPPIELYE